MDQDLVSIRYTREKSTHTFLLTPRTYESGLDHLHIRFSHFSCLQKRVDAVPISDILRA